MDYSILHITDLHLNDFYGGDEHLRKKFYKEYIDNFTSTILESQNKVDFLIITGDFVDIGKTENFIHIEEIINYLAKKLNLKNNQIGVCIGNHDFEKNKFNGSNSLLLREKYYKFSENYINKSFIKKNDRAIISKVKDNYFFLSLDSTLSSDNKENNKPGLISLNEIDDIVNDFIMEHVPETSTLLIASHYPIDKFPNHSLEVDEENWYENHVWSNAVNLRTRIKKLNIKNKFWFLGDTHAPGHIRYGNTSYIMTGRFGCSTKNISQIPRQAKLIKIQENGECQINTFNYFMESHTDNPQNGTWLIEPDNLKDKEPYLIKNEPKILIDNNKLDLICDDIETVIRNKIIRNKLYNFGRFKTSKSTTSLGWISINLLLNESKILSSIIRKSIERINNVIKPININTAIIGLDFWGAIIGSHVSVGTGINHYCIATRGGGQFHTQFEFKNKSLQEKIKNLTLIIIFTDVISNGTTINKVIESIEHFSEKKNIEFHVISIISDNMKNNDHFSNKLKTLGTFCKTLKIPVIENELLPEEDFVPINIDFSI